MPEQPATQSTAWRVFSLGVGYGMAAVHIIGNGLLLSTLGQDEAAAVPLIGSTQAVVSGIVYGLITSTSVELAKALGLQDENKKNVGAVIKLSWVVGAGASLFSTACFLSTPGIMPLIVTPGTGRAVGNFFLTFAAGGFAEPMAANTSLILNQVEKNMWIPLVGSVIYRGSALGFSYFLSRYFHLGALGVGLGTGAMGAIYFVGTQLLFTRKAYADMELSRLCYIPGFKERLKAYFSGGWKFILQRLSEWGNLFATYTVIGALSNTELVALNPAGKAITLIGYLIQGMGLGAMMFFLEDCREKQKCLEQFKQTPSAEDLERFLDFHNMTKRTFIKNNLISLGLTAAASTAIYLARAPIIDLLLGPDIVPAQFQLAEEFLLYILIKRVGRLTFPHNFEPDFNDIFWSACGLRPFNAHRKYVAIYLGAHCYYVVICCRKYLSFC